MYVYLVIGAVIAGLLGALWYYVRKGVNLERDVDSLKGQSERQDEAIQLGNSIRAGAEREERRDEAEATRSVDRDAANKLLLDALKDLN